MPGLSQLKQFSSDILSVGNEPELKAKRGEKAVSFPIPKDVKDEDDSDDFVMGMPEPVESTVKNEKKSEPEDFSDITGESSKPSEETNTSQKTEAESAPEISLPGLSNVIDNQDSNQQENEPDLSMFMDEPEKEEPPEPEKPKEKQIDELSLDDLLSGAGFDGSEGMEEPSKESDKDSSSEKKPEEDEADKDISNENQETENASENAQTQDTAKIQDAPLPQNPQKEEKPVDKENVSSKPNDDFPDLNDILNKNDNLGSNDNFANVDNLENLENLETPETSKTQEIPENKESPQSQDNLEPLDNLDNIENLDNLDFASNASDADDVLKNQDVSQNEKESVSPKTDNGGIEEVGDSDVAPGSSFSLDDFPELKEASTNANQDASISSNDDFGSLEDIPELSDEDNFSFDNLGNLDNNDEKSQEPEKSEPDEIDGIKVTEDPSIGEEKKPDDSDFSFNAPDDMDFSFDEPSDIKDEKSASNETSDDDFGVPVDVFEPDDSSKKDNSENQTETKAEAETSTDNIENPDNFVNSDFGNDDKSGDFLNESLDSPDFSVADDKTSEKKPETSDSDTIDISPNDIDINDMDLNLPEDVPGSEEKDKGESKSSENAEESKKEESDFPEGFNFNLDDDDFDSSSSTDDSEKQFEEGPAPEKYDMSAMEGLDFPDTDSQLKGSNGDFEFHNGSDMPFENGDFEIPGYTGDDILDEKQQDKLRNRKPEPKNVSEEELPENTLSDEQYKRFLKNLSGYPLNVRIAVEDLIVKNEFTDDAEFEIIQKVLKKVPARTLASDLEKMLDVPISVPRDFEKRTGEEYEAYKASLSYQLRNRIIPGAILSVIALAFCVGLFFFIKNCVYKPIMASSLYKQGYTLLEGEDYPASELKFNQATNFSIEKKWFYKYAEGYRNHKQYIRAEEMYKRTLARFNHEKQAGLEYADMELSDLANYEKAEEILLREVLDNYINDPDGLLLLGDTYLEWATEKDPSKFENARLRYSELLQLYGSKNNAKNLLYKGRMMRYFVRTDNLLEVLNLKDGFMASKKSLSADDWTEMSGYLLEKLYGPLPPSEEYLRTKIEDVKEMLLLAIRENPLNPVASYNLGKYYVYMNNSENAKQALDSTIKLFGNADRIKKRDMYKYIDSYRLYGEEFTKGREYLKALEQYTNGISLYQNERDGNGFEGNQEIGKLYEDTGDINYFISGDMENALLNYESSINTMNDLPEIRYKIGYIKYNSENYGDALGSFMKVGEEYPDDINYLLAMGNTLSLRNDNFASQGYYEHLLRELDLLIRQKEIVFPQANVSHAEIIDSYMRGTNNLGVTLYRLARRTGSSTYNAKAMVNFQESLRAWDSLTRNQETMLRLPGGNLAEQNLKYISHPMPEYEPAIYTELPKTLYGEEELR